MTAFTVRASDAPASQLRLTQRGRRLLAAVLLSPLVLGIGIGLAQMPVALAEHDEHAAGETFETHTVLTGETLWTIAESIAGNQDVRDVVQDIMRLNLLETSSLQSGQQLALPNY